MTISEMLLPEFDEEMANTRKVLERFPEGQNDYKPHDKSMALGYLAGHIASLPEWAATTFSGESINFEPGEMKPFIPGSRQELLETFDRHVATARVGIAAASDQDMATVFTVNFGGKPMMSEPRIKMVRSMVMNHLIHHRAQLGVYLRLNDIAIPGMYGPSADEGQWGGQAQAQTAG